MSSESQPVLTAIDRWEQAGLIDAETAVRLRDEVAETSEASAKRVSQYVLATTGGAVLLLAGVLFLQWAWPLLPEYARVFVLGGGGVGVIAVGSRMEETDRLRPAGYMIQTVGLTLLLTMSLYAERAWDDMTLGGFVVGGLGLAVPIAMAPGAMRRNVVMPAVHLAFALAFFAVFLDRATPLTGDEVVWAVDAMLLVAIMAMVRLIAIDPSGERHPWAFNAFVMSMVGGFVMITWTSLGPLRLGDRALIPLDAWLLITAALTLWGLHWGPDGLRRANLARMLAYLAFLWIPFGFLTAYVTFDGGSTLALAMVGGVGVIEYLHAHRYRLGELQAAASVSFIAALWVWAVDQGGALGAVGALVLTAALLFWLSGRSPAHGSDTPGAGSG